ncbi:hypothetical protein ONZ45_g13072 [Pleurotus djamor]|nr:hypothetical protein ONZ45_g13072 [Pleurotus djamor]
MLDAMSTPLNIAASDGIVPPHPTPEPSRPASPSPSIRAVYVRSRPTSVESNETGTSIHEALRTLLNSAATAHVGTGAKSLDATLTVVNVNSDQAPRFRTVRLVDTVVDRAPSSTPSTHTRTRTWSIKQLGSLISRKVDPELDATVATKPERTRSGSLGSRFSLSRRPSASNKPMKGVENTPILKTRLRPARSLERLDSSFVDGLEDEGLDEATADAARAALNMTKYYGFEQVEPEVASPTKPSGTKSLFNVRR